MPSVITAILTDKEKRDPEAVGAALKQEAEVAAPWNSQLN